MSALRGLLLSLLSLASLAQTQKAPAPPVPNLYIITPGVRVGPVTRDITIDALRSRFGPNAQEEEIDQGNGSLATGLVLYPADPSRRLELAWSQTEPRRVKRIRICPTAKTGPCLWRTATGIGIGTTLRQLELRNGKPFRLWMPESNGDGTLIHFDGGRLGKELALENGFHVRLVPRMDSAGHYLPKLSEEERTSFLSEEQTISTHPILKKLNPAIGEMWLDFTPKP